MDFLKFCIFEKLICIYFTKIRLTFNFFCRFGNFFVLNSSDFFIRTGKLVKTSLDFK